MPDPIGHFRDEYADQFARGMSRFLELHGQIILSQLHRSLERPRSTVYLFGNGGCYAISKCFEYAIQAYAFSRGLPLRTQTGVDVHSLSSSTIDAAAGMPFLRVLEAEGATADDIVILISGSGNSDNLCEVAAYAERVGIPTLALVGSSRGKLREVLPPSRCFYVQPEDQQISEDIIQSVAYFIGQSMSDLSQTDWLKTVSSKTEALGRVVRGIPSSFVSAAANLIVESFCADKLIWVLGIDDPVLSVCAEHTAHNLYWDSIYEVNNPPERLIRSSPTGCDYSGISNDRRRGIVSNLIGSPDNKTNGMAMLYSMNSTNPGLRYLLDRFNEQEVPVFLFSSHMNLPLSYPRLTVYQTGLEDRQMQAGASQILGHILGRVTRMKLLERRGPPDEMIAHPARFLVERDLAQRRLLDG